MISRPLTSLARMVAVRGPLLAYPIFVIAAVALITVIGIRRIERPTSDGDHFNTRTYLASSQYGSCLSSLKHDASAGVKISSDEIEACEDKDASAIDDIVKTRVDDLRWMLEIIGSIAGFFVIAQSGAAFFSALIYTQQAEKALKQIGEIQDAVTARYPVFRSVEEHRTQALTDLAYHVKTSTRADDPEADPTEVLDKEYRNTLYASMELKERQTLLSVESFASVDLDAGPQGSDGHSDNLRRLAIFYQSKFQYERNLGFGALSDLERAQWYLCLAIEKSRGDFTLQNDLGTLCMDVLKATKDRNSYQDIGKDYWKAADKAFGESLRIEAHQMRAHYNRAVLLALYGRPANPEEQAGEDARKRRYLLAIEELNKALDLSPQRWQKADAPSIVKAMIFYNRGCYRAWLLGADATKNPLTIDEARDFLADLQKAVELGGVPAEYVNTDWNPTEDDRDKADIYGAYQKSTEQLKGQLDEVKLALLKSFMTERKGLFSAFKDAWTAGVRKFKGLRKP